MMPTCIFRSAFNFNLPLPQDRGFNVFFNNSPAFLRCLSRKGDLIISYLEGKYDWLIKGNGVKIYHVTAIKTSGDRELIRQFYTYDDVGKDIFCAGVVDKIKYTIIELFFNIDTIEILDDKKSFNSLKAKVFEFLSNYIDLYRLSTQDITFARSLLKKHPIIEVLTSEENIDLSKPIIEGSFNSYKVELSWDDPAERGYMKSNVSEESINILVEGLRKDKRIELYEKLLLDAMEQAQINNSNNLSVILVENAFEVFLKEVLTQACKYKKIKRLPVGRGKNYEKDFRDAILEGNVREDLIFNYLKRIIGEESYNQNIAGRKIYNEWYNRTYKLRNEIIHKGKYEINSEQAKQAFQSTINFMNLIIQVLNQSMR